MKPDTKSFYLVTIARKDDGTIQRRYPVEAPDIASAAKTTLAELDILWEIIRIAVLR